MSTAQPMNVFERSFQEEWKHIAPLLPPMANMSAWQISIMLDGAILCAHPECLPQIVTKEIDGTLTCVPLKLKSLPLGGDTFDG